MIVALLVVLLLPVVGWASEGNAVKCRAYLDKHEGYVFEGRDCNGGYGVQIDPDSHGKQIWSNSCYERMREAMREATLFINQKAGRVIYEKNGKMWVVPDPALVDGWNAVMRDCVKGE